MADAQSEQPALALLQSQQHWWLPLRELRFWLCVLLMTLRVVFCDERCCVLRRRGMRNVIFSGLSSTDRR
jgi:hypothetical protein